MAKRKTKRRSRKRGFLGSTFRVRKLRGVGQLDKPDTVVGAALPVVLGAGTVALTQVGIRNMLTPGQSELQDMIIAQAPWVSLVAGGLTALALGQMVGQPAGVSAAAGAVVVAGAHVVRDMTQGNTLAGMYGRLGDIVMEPAADRGYGAPPNVRGLQAVVPEYGVQGLGSYGERVSIGAIQIADKFGTQAF